MKKTLLSAIALILTIIMSVVMVPVVKAEEKVPVYMFTKDGCSACIAAHEYFDELAKEYPDLFDLVELEVFDNNWNITSEDLQNLLIDTYERFEEDTSSVATPTIVIGDYHTIGLPKDTNVIYEAITEAKNSKKDVVKDIAENLGIDIEKLRKTDSTTTDTVTDESGKYDTIIIIGIFIVLIGGFAGLVIASKKQ